MQNRGNERGLLHGRSLLLGEEVGRNSGKKVVRNDSGHAKKPARRKILLLFSENSGHVKRKESVNSLDWVAFRRLGGRCHTII